MATEHTELNKVELLATLECVLGEVRGLREECNSLLLQCARRVEATVYNPVITTPMYLSHQAAPTSFHEDIRSRTSPFRNHPLTQY